MIRLAVVSALLLTACSNPTPKPIKPSAKKHIMTHVDDSATVEGVLETHRIEGITEFFIGAQKLNLKPLLGFTDQDIELYFSDYIGWRVKIYGVRDDAGILNAFSIEVAE